MKKRDKNIRMEMVRERRPDLYYGMLQLLEHGEILLRAAKWDNDRVEEWVKRSEGALSGDGDWDKKEAMREEGEKLYKRLEIARGELNKMNRRYTELRKEIKKEFGDDISWDDNRKGIPPEDGDTDVGV